MQTHRLAAETPRETACLATRERRERHTHMGPTCAALVLSLFTLLSLALLAAVASAQTTFGVNLDRPVASSVTCAVHPYPGYPYTTVGGPSCTWFTYGQEFTVTESTQVPSGHGTITKVRVKEGADTGPMKITVLLRQGFAMNGLATACCVGVAESQAFTPTANAITEVPVNFPVFNGTNPATGVPEIDYLAITVLDESTSVPLSETAIDGTYQGTTFYPAVTLGQERLDGGLGNYGFIALINADWTETPAPPKPTPKPTPTTTTTTPTPPPPPPPKPEPVAPKNTGLPVIKGKAKNRSKLQTSTGTWTGTSPMTYRYQWVLCNKRLKGCKNIHGATSSTLALTKVMVGHRLAVYVLAVNSKGLATATSKATAAIKK